MSNSIGRMSVGMDQLVDLLDEAGAWVVIDASGDPVGSPVTSLREAVRVSEPGDAAARISVSPILVTGVQMGRLRAARGV